MKAANLLMLTLGVALSAHADFSYTTTTKGAQGAMGAAAGPQSMRQHFKGQKMKNDNGGRTTIIDFDAQTITSIDNREKSYSVMSFADAGKAMQQTGAAAKIDVKETGQRKTISGFNASETIMTIQVEGRPDPRAPGMNMQIEMAIWTSPDVPGAQELRAFYQKNGARFPWAAMAGGNPGMQKSMAELQQKISSLNGVPLLQVTKVKSGGGNNPQMAQALAGTAQAMAQLEQMKKQGGAQAAAAEKALASMGGGTASGGAIFEMTTESSDFSIAAIPDSVFAIPAGYQKK